MDHDEPASLSKYHHPYFTPGEVDYLSAKQRGKLTTTQEDKVRQNACGFIEALGTKVGFPRRTLATAQNLYHRFHLFFPRKDFNYLDVSLAAVYVSTKMHDTLKKPRELLAVSYAIRYPELAAKSKSPGGELDVDTLDQVMVENDRQRLLAVERLMLETICFNFTSRMPFPYVIKIGRALKASKQLTKLAWRLAIDSHRTLVPIQYPPHVLALGSIYIAALLSTFEQPNLAAAPGCHSDQEIASSLSRPGEWQETFSAQIEDLQEIAHVVLDLLITGAQNPSANTSPSTPQPSPSSPPSDYSALQNRPRVPMQAQYKADQLVRLKITMRENEHKPRQRQPVGSADPDPSALYSGEERKDLGKNEGTVRFLFGPPGVADGA